MIPVLLSLVMAPATVDVRVDGEGYLRFARAGKVVYAAKASLTAVNGALSTSQGDLLLPRLAVSASAKAFRIDLEGNVTADGASLGRIVLATFPAGTRLTPAGAFLTTAAKPTLANPGEGTTGVLRTGTAAPAAAIGTTTVSIRVRTEVDADQFAIGDVATIDGDPTLVAKVAAVPMGASPLVGTERGLAAAHLLGRLRLAGVDTKQVTLTVPTGAVVVRRAQTISPEAIVEAAREAVRRKHGLDLPLVPTKDEPPMTIAPGVAKVTAEAGTISSGGIPVTVTVRIGERLVGSRRLTMLPEGGNVGVKAGETVRVRLTTNGASIELEGRATTGGWIGQTVTVTVAAGDKNTTLSGTVREPGVVEVKA